MIPSQQEEVLRIFNLVAEQQEDGLQALLPSINIVAQEEVVGTRWESAHFEEPDQIAVLPMHISHNLHRRRQLDQRGLRKEDLAGCLTDGRDLRILEANGFRYLSRVARIEQAGDHVVNVERLRLRG